MRYGAKKLKTFLLTMSASALLCFCPASEASQFESKSATPNATANLTFPQESRDLEIKITALRSTAYGWAPGEKLHLLAYTEHSDKKNNKQQSRTYDFDNSYVPGHQGIKNAQIYGPKRFPHIFSVRNQRIACRPCPSQAIGNV